MGKCGSNDAPLRPLIFQSRDVGRNKGKERETKERSRRRWKARGEQEGRKLQSSLSRVFESDVILQQMRREAKHREQEKARDREEGMRESERERARERSYKYESTVL